MGDGEYARRDKYKGTGNFRKIRTDVTMVRNKTFATRWFVRILFNFLHQK